MENFEFSVVVTDFGLHAPQPIEIAKDGKDFEVFIEMNPFQLVSKDTYRFNPAVTIYVRDGVQLYPVKSSCIFLITCSNPKIADFNLPESQMVMTEFVKAVFDQTRGLAQLANSLPDCPPNFRGKKWCHYMTLYQVLEKVRMLVTLWPN